MEVEPFPNFSQTGYNQLQASTSALQLSGHGNHPNLKHFNPDFEDEESTPRAAPEEYGSNNDERQDTSNAGSAGSYVRTASHLATSISSQAGVPESTPMEGVESEPIHRRKSLQHEMTDSWLRRIHTCRQCGKRTRPGKPCECAANRDHDQANDYPGDGGVSSIDYRLYQSQQYGDAIQTRGGRPFLGSISYTGVTGVHNSMARGHSGTASDKVRPAALWMESSRLSQDLDDAAIGFHSGRPV